MKISSSSGILLRISRDETVEKEVGIIKLIASVLISHIDLKL